MISLERLIEMELAGIGPADLRYRQEMSGGRYQVAGPARDAQMRAAFLAGSTIAKLAHDFDLTDGCIRYHLRKMKLIPERNDKDAERLARAKAKAADWIAKKPGRGDIQSGADIWTPERQWQEMRTEAGIG